MTSATRRLTLATTLGATALVLGAAATSAQAPPAPAQLQVTLEPGKAPVLAPTPLRPGATEIVVTATKGERGFLLARLRPGVTAEQIRTMTEKEEINERELDRLGKKLTVFVTAMNTPPRQAARTTVDLAAGTYVAMDITSRKRNPQVAFDVAGESTGAALPASDATIDMDDYKFRKYRSTLPAEGTLRVRNVGKQLHFLLAFPASSSRNASRLVALLKKNDERRAGKLIAGPPTEPVSIVSPGTDNRVPVKLRKGYYALVCFYGSPASRNKQHNALGMARKVQFK